MNEGEGGDSLSYKLKMKGAIVELRVPLGALKYSIIFHKYLYF